MRLTKKRKMTISGGLTAFAVVLAVLSRSSCCYLAALAMGISTLGDALLAGYPECIENKLAKGGLAFLAAHILYICTLFVSYWKSIPALLPRFALPFVLFLALTGKSIPALLPRFALPFVLFLALTVLHGLLFYSRGNSGFSTGLFTAASFYLLTVGIHAAAAVTVYGQAGGGYLLSAAGAILFFLSDAVLLARKYGAVRGKYVTAVIWLTYVPAQLCLITGIFLTRSVFA